MEARNNIRPGSPLDVIADKTEMEFTLTDVYCIFCLGRGTGLALLDGQPRKGDGRRPSVCNDCWKVIRHNDQPTLWMSRKPPRGWTDADYRDKKPNRDDK